MNKDHWIGVLFILGALDFVFLASIIYSFAEKLIN